MQIRETTLAVAKLAEEQLAIMQRLDNAAIVIGDVRRTGYRAGATTCAAKCYHR